MAPSSVRECTARTTIRARRQSIITLVILSTPFCSPSEQMPKDRSTARIIQKVIVPVEC